MTHPIDAPARYPYPKFERVAGYGLDAGRDGWQFDVGHATFRAIREPDRPRGRDWTLVRQVKVEAGEDQWVAVYVDLPSREAALVEAESIVELEEKAAERRRLDAKWDAIAHAGEENR